jgi:hypothetical protein
MWMGGTIPLGYDVKDRKLVVNEAEAETVRLIFRRYRVTGRGASLEGDHAPESPSDLQLAGAVLSTALVSIHLRGFFSSITAHVAAAVIPPSATSSKTSSGVPIGAILANRSMSARQLSSAASAPISLLMM